MIRSSPAIGAICLILQQSATIHFSGVRASGSIRARSTGLSIVTTILPLGGVALVTLLLVGFGPLPCVA